MESFSLTRVAPAVSIGELPHSYGLDDRIGQYVAYAEGEGLSGGDCGKWLTFHVRKLGGVIQGMLRLHLEYCDDAAFRSSVFINHAADERDLLRDAPSCFNNRLANNSVADSIEHNFVWDVCVVNKETYKVRYRVTVKGTYLLHVKLDGNSVSGSPFKIFISEAAQSVPACRIYGPNVYQCHAIPYVPEIIGAIFPPSDDVTSPVGHDDKQNQLQIAGRRNSCRLRANDTNLKLTSLDSDPSFAGNTSRGAGIGKDYNFDGQMPECATKHMVNEGNDGCAFNREDKPNTLLPVTEGFHNHGSHPKADAAKRQRALQYLELCDLVNEVEVHLSDENGNAISNCNPFVRAWGSNYARVVNLENKGNGIISVKYVVVLPRDGIRLIRSAQRRAHMPKLPSSLQESTIPCLLNIEINGEPVFGSPFQPSVNNITEIEEYYQVSTCGGDATINKFEDLLNKNDIEGCFVIYKACENRSMKDRMTCILLEKLAKLEGNNIATSGDMAFVKSLKFQSLGKLLELVHSQYKKMLTYKTSNIINCIRELKSFGGDNTGRKDADGKPSNSSKQFNNLGDVILNYRLIGDELRKLHRYELADKFDRINDRMCDEIDIEMWDSIIGQKETKIQKLRTEVKEAFDRLNEFKTSINAKYDKNYRQDLDDFKHMPGFALDKSSQTGEQQYLSPKLSSLVQHRCAPTHTRNNLDLLVESHWRNCNNYDIHVTITKVLKSTVRLKNTLSEIFSYYATQHPIGKGRSVTGMTRASMELFVVESRLNRYLVRNEPKLSWLFSKFAVDVNNPEDKDKRAKTSVIPEYLWCAFIRELAYLNLLYTIVESGDKEMLRDFQHPSRLVSFYHFCNEHLTALYEHLFLSKPEFQKCLKFSDNSSIPGSKNAAKSLKKPIVAPTEHYFTSRKDMVKYFTSKAVETVLNYLDLEVLQMVFKHYSRVSMYGRAAVPHNWFNDDATIGTSTFVVFARDFQIIPGYLSGETVQEIVRNVVTKDGTRTNKLNLRDFVNAVAKTVAKAVMGICLARYDVHKSRIEELHLSADAIPRVVQSRESVSKEISMIINSFGLSDSHMAKFTIDAIYGPEALNYL